MEKPIWLAILLCVLCGLAQWKFGVNIASEWLGDFPCFAASVTFALDLYFSQVFRAHAHWRTLPLMLVNFWCSFVYLCLGLSLFIKECPAEALWRPGKLLHPVVSMVLHLHSTLNVRYVVLPLAVLTAVVVYVFPVPSLPALKGKYKQVGTLNFTLPMKLFGSESQLYKGAGVHVGGDSENLDTETYDLTVQCWFPVLTEEPALHRYARQLGFRTATTTMWSSGHPQSQDQESRYLLERVAAMGGIPSMLFSHLAKARSHSTFYHSMDGIFGLKENTPFGEDIASIGNWESDVGGGKSSRPGSANSVSGTPKGSPARAGEKPFLLPSPVKSMIANANPLKNMPLFPIAVYSHGNYGWRQIATSTFEALASQGFVVFSMDHAPSCLSARPLSNQVLPSKPPHVLSNPYGYTDFDYLLPKDITPGTLGERDFFAGGIDRRVREIQCLLDYLCTPHDGNGGLLDGYSSEDSMDYKEQDYLANTWDNVSNAGSALGGDDAPDKPAKTLGRALFHVDVEKICLFGHSFGAGTSIATACRDPRIRAVCALDSWMYPAKDAYSSDPKYTGFAPESRQAADKTGTSSAPSDGSAEAGKSPGLSLIFTDPEDLPVRSPSPKHGGSQPGSSSRSAQHSPTRPDRDTSSQDTPDVRKDAAAGSGDKEWYEGNSDDAEGDDFSDSDHEADTDDDDDEFELEEGEELPSWAGGGAGSPARPAAASPEKSPTKRRVSVSFTSGEAVTTDPRSIVKERRRSSANTDALQDVVSQLQAEEAAEAAAAAQRSGPAAINSSQKHLASALGPKILFLSSEQWNIAPKQAVFRQAFVNKCFRANVFNIVVLGTNHQNFCDSHLLVNKKLMSGNGKLGSIDPFENIDALNEVVSSFLAQACSGVSYEAGSDETHASLCELSSAPRLEPDSKRLLGYLKQGRSFSALSRTTSSDSIASINDDNVHDVIHSVNHGLALNSKKRRGVSSKSASFISYHFRDEAALPGAIDWKFAHWCDPVPTPSEPLGPPDDHLQ